MNLKKRSELFAFVAVLVAALFSGAASLSYEVVWSRLLVVPLGNSSDANAMVLAAFMLGIAVGALLLGRVADKVASPLRLYALLEVGLGLFALLMPTLIGGIDGIESLRGTLAEHPLAAVGRYVGAFVLIIAPSLLMGATIPVLVRALSLEPADLRRRIGLIYGTNTIGAALGATITGFIAIPTFGFTRTCMATAVCNFIAAAIVLTTRRFKGERELDFASFDERVETDDDALLPSRAVAAAALIAATIAGFTMLSAEVLWSRTLTFVFGHDTYAFATLLAVVLLGLGIGGVVHRRLTKANPLALLAVLLGLLALTLVASYWAAAAIIIHLGRDPFSLETSGTLATSLRLELYREMAYTPILVLIPSIISGALFPAACALYAGPLRSAGGRVGTATLVNGLGSAVGSLVTSFVLVAAVGIERALLIATEAAVLGSLFAVMVFMKRMPIRKGILLVTPAFLALICALLLPGSLPMAMLKEAVGVRHQDLLYYEEGRTGTVSVTRNTINAEKQLFMNAVNEVTSRVVHDQSFKLLGHLGPLLHPKAEQGAMICLGAGLSAGAALTHPLASLDVVELSSSIPHAARLWRKENHYVLEDPRFKLHIADGRHYLLSTDKRFDVIMVDSTHPKAVDSWILYTREFYELVRARLKKNGIAVQWVPLHGLSETELKIIVRTFFEVFPQTTLWVNVGFEVYGQAAYLKLVGTKAPLLIDYRELSLRMKESRVQRDLAPYGMGSAEEILSCFLASPPAIDRWTKGIPVQTDDRPIVPYTTWYSKGRRMTAPLLLAVRSSVIPLLRNMGDKAPEIEHQLKVAEDAQGFLLAGMLDRAAETWPESAKIRLFKDYAEQGRSYYIALSKKYADNPEKLFEIGSLLGNLGFPADARPLYQRAYDTNPADPRFAINLALVDMDLGNIDQAVKLLTKTVKRFPNNGLAYYNLGVALLRAGEAGTAIDHLERALAILPDLIGAKLSLAEALLAMGQLEKADAVLRDITATNAFVAEAWDMRGLIAAKVEEWDQAKSYHIKALNLEPFRASAHYNLGIVLEQERRLKEAAIAYQTALRIEPRDAEAENNLGMVYAEAGLYDLAAEAHRKALDIEPHYAEAAYNLGLAYLGMGQILPATEAFGLALKIDPDLAPAKKALDKLQVKVEIETDGGVPTDKAPPTP